MQFPGTITLPNEFFMKVTEYAARSFKVNGFKDIVFIGDSGGNQKGMAAVADMLNKEWANTDVRVHFASNYYDEKANGFQGWLQAQAETAEQIGTHAGISDTSQLMALNPNWIRKDKLAPGGDRKLTGVSGDPRRASIAYGKKGLEFKIEAAVAQIQKSIAGRDARK
jgi:creatinine amidohydrolase/Fe(II)-dependent formamide hydrolase-like protein